MYCNVGCRDPELHIEFLENSDSLVQRALLSCRIVITLPSCEPFLLNTRVLAEW